MSRRALRPLRWLAFVVVVACDGVDGLAGLEQDPPDLFWKLELNQHAINLSTDQSRPEYYTYQLVATPLRLDGSVLEDDDAEITWTTADTNRVKVDATGKLTAKAVTNSPIRIIASMSGGPGPVTNADTAFVVVTSGVKSVQSFSIQPPRTTFGVGWDTLMVATVLDETGTSIPRLQVAYRSSLPKVANYSAAGLFQPMTMGTVTLNASAAIYGAEFEDEVEITVGEPAVAQVNIGFFIPPTGGFDTYFDPQVVTIKAGMGVAWSSRDGIGATIVFDDPTNVGPSPADGLRGNPGAIFAFGLTRVIRTFPVPGTYHYRDAAAGKTGTGTIIVEP